MKREKKKIWDFLKALNKANRKKNEEEKIV